MIQYTVKPAKFLQKITYNMVCITEFIKIVSEGLRFQNGPSSLAYEFIYMQMYFSHHFFLGGVWFLLGFVFKIW